jgi:hypothetical protein
MMLQECSTVRMNVEIKEDEEEVCHLLHVTVVKWAVVVEVCER